MPMPSQEEASTAREQGPGTTSPASSGNSKHSLSVLNVPSQKNMNAVVNMERLIIEGLIVFPRIPLKAATY